MAAKHTTNNTFLQGISWPSEMPTALQIDAVMKRVQHNPTELHYAICGTSGTHLKSSVINAFRGPLKQHDGAAISRFVWLDISRPGTTLGSDLEYFIDQGPFVVDFVTEEGDARAVDSARGLIKCKQKRPFNFPCDDFNADSEEIPAHLNLNNLRDDSMFKEITIFVKRKAQEYAASFCPNKIVCISISSGQQLAKHNSLEPYNEEEKFAKLEERAHLKAVKADLTGDGSTCPSSEPDEHESWRLNVPKIVEDEELNDGSSATDESEAEVTADSPCLESNSNYAGRKRRNIDDDDLLTKLAPFIKQQIEDALNSTLLPLVSVLRSREEDEQKHRENMLVLEEQKLALKREKLRFKRRRVSLQVQHGPKASYLGGSGYKKHGRGLRLRTSDR